MHMVKFESYISQSDMVSTLQEKRLRGGRQVSHWPVELQVKQPGSQASRVYCIFMQVLFIRVKPPSQVMQVLSAEQFSQ